MIARMARLRGIGDAYFDYRGELRYFSLETKIALLRAMRCDVDNADALAQEVSRLERSQWLSLLPPVVVIRGARIAFDINVPARDLGGGVSWAITFADATRREGIVFAADCPEVWRGEAEGTVMTRRRLELPFDVEPGYHEFELKLAERAAEQALLIASAHECHEPPAIVAGARLWGAAIQLYTLRSRNNWGMGDFEDLKMLIRWMASCGAGFIGLNPLHALAPSDPARASPYSASSRYFLNVLYIAVPAVREYAQCIPAQQRVGEVEFTARLATLRAGSHVDYAGVAAAKFEILALLYAHFREHHLATRSARADEFRAFATAGGAPLEAHARFDALDRHFCKTFGTPSGWMNWPEAYRDAQGAAAKAFAIEHPQDVEFFIYLQWLAHEQLLSAQSLTRDLDMPVGLYGDYAVGANPSGSETWSDQSSYCMGAEIGAPPDSLALKGQGWGIPPQDPFIMQTERLQGFVHLIRNNMRYYGALRLDHVMSLFRLWWVAAGASPVEGAYVHYPLEQLLGVLTLESERNRCLVVGEDLGVVPDEMRKAMPAFGIYHYKVMLFEKIDGRLRRPDEYLQRALATVTTHDMPTLHSYWEDHDIELRRRLDLYPSVAIEAEVRHERAQDREIVLQALREQGLAPAQPATGLEPFTPALAEALHVYLARSATILVAIQVEDLLGMVDPVNVPGTYLEYPNWQRKLSAELEDLIVREDLRATLGKINAARRG